MQPENLQGIEQLFFGHEQLRARELIGWGIACGFRVGIDGTAADTANSRNLQGGGIVLKGAQTSC